MSRRALCLAALLLGALVAGQALAQGPSSRLLFRLGYAVSDMNTDFIYYFGEALKLPQGDRYATANRLKGKIADMDRQLAQARCRLDLRAFTARFRSLVEAATPDPKVVAEPADQTIPFFLALNQCVDEQTPLPMRDYFLYGATVAELRYVLEVLPASPGAFDGETLDRLDRLVRIGPQISQSPEFPSAGRACADRLVAIAQAHRDKQGMDAATRKQVGDCARQLAQAFLG